VEIILAETDDEHVRVQREAEAFLQPILPLLDNWEARLLEQGITMNRRLIIGAYPSKDDPPKAGLLVGLKRMGSGGTLYFLESYMPNEAAWLAAEISLCIERQIEQIDAHS
jgi:hypothetical protein